MGFDRMGRATPLRITGGWSLLIAACVILTGCATGGPAVPSAAPTASTAPSASPAETPTPTPTPLPTDAGSVDECDAAQLSIEIEAQPTASGAGQSYSEITFINVGETTCLLVGAPSVVNLVDTATGAVIGERGADEGVEEQVEVGPGQAAYSTIHFTAAGAYDCETGVADAALVAPPKPQTTGPVDPIVLERPVTVCTDPATYSVSYVASSSPF